MRKKILSLALVFAMAFSLSACDSKKSSDDGTATDSAVETTAEAQEKDSIDYLALVNKLNPLPDGWEDALEISTCTNSIGDEVEVEKKAYDAYLKLKEDLEKEDIHVDLDSARRSVEDQQRIMDDFIKEYGEDYAKKTVATPGYSEHHTGLALDLYLIIDGKDVIENEDMIKYTDIWAKIHEKLPEYGFILRYLPDKEYITGYGYEPWHIRYVDSPEIAKEITDKGVTLEGYLGAVNETEVKVDLGTSEIFKEEELNEAAIQIKCDFASWKGCELKSLRYAGDDGSSKEKVDWVNSLSDDYHYTKVAEFIGDFHTPKEGSGTREPDKDYNDYQWWLALNDEGDWDIVQTGY